MGVKLSEEQICITCPLTKQLRECLKKIETLDQIAELSTSILETHSFISCEVDACPICEKIEKILKLKEALK